MRDVRISIRSATTGGGTHSQQIISNTEREGKVKIQIKYKGEKERLQYKYKYSGRKERIHYKYKYIR